MDKKKMKIKKSTKINPTPTESPPLLKQGTFRGLNNNMILRRKLKDGESLEAIYRSMEQEAFKKDEYQVLVIEDCKTPDPTDMQEFERLLKGQHLNYHEQKFEPEVETAESGLGRIAFREKIAECHEREEDPFGYLCANYHPPQIDVDLDSVQPDGETAQLVIRKVLEEGRNTDWPGYRYYNGMSLEGAKELSVLQSFADNVSLISKKNYPLTKNLPGIIEIMIYIGLQYSHSPMQIENKILANANLVRFNIEADNSKPSKLWILIYDGVELETRFNKKFPGYNCYYPLHHRGLYLTLELLEYLNKDEVQPLEFGILYQYPGQLVITRCHVYHQVINISSNVCEAINIASPEWHLKQSLFATCSCTDKAQITKIQSNPLVRLRLKIKMDRNHFCKECRVINFRRAVDLKKHMMQEHGVKKLFKCSECLQGFNSQSALTRHKRIHLTSACPKCHKRMKNLKFHLNICSGLKLKKNGEVKREIICPVCHKRIKSQNHDCNPVNCEDCGKKFASDKTLKKHKKISCKG